jgi:hypothetical protein
MRPPRFNSRRRCRRRRRRGCRGRSPRRRPAQTRRCCRPVPARPPARPARAHRTHRTPARTTPPGQRSPRARLGFRPKGLGRAGPDGRTPHWRRRVNGAGRGAGDPGATRGGAGGRVGLGNGPRRRRAVGRGVRAQGLLERKERAKAEYRLRRTSALKAALRTAQQAPAPPRPLPLFPPCSPTPTAHPPTPAAHTPYLPPRSIGRIESNLQC